MSRIFALPAFPRLCLFYTCALLAMLLLPTAGYQAIKHALIAFTDLSQAAIYFCALLGGAVVLGALVVAVEALTQAFVEHTRRQRALRATAPASYAMIDMARKMGAPIQDIPLSSFNPIDLRGLPRLA